MAIDGRILKRSARRSVRIAQRDGRDVVVKRFEHDGLLARAFDGARARREHALLERLAQAGVDVPRPLGLARDGRAREVLLEWIPGARTLAEVLAGPERPPARLAHALGRLLGGLHAAGVDHRDLHAGNVLVTADGRAVAVDFDKARLGGPLDAARARRDLVATCAGVRERTSARWRAVAFAAWWRALDAGTRARLARPDPLAVERRARERRRRVVESRARRWLAGGTAVEALAPAGALARRGLDPEACARALAEQPGPGGPVGDRRGPGWLRIEGSRRAVRALWLAMARLEEHGVPAPRCALLVDARRARAWFLPPPAPDALPRSRRGPARGALLGALLDRGLWVDGAADVSGSSLARPLPLVALRAGEARAKLEACAAQLAPRERDALVRGVRAAWRGTARELDALLSRRGGRGD